MRGFLELDMGVLRRGGPISLLEAGGYLIIVNPSEVLAHEDEITIRIKGGRVRVTDQAYTKVLKGSRVRISVEIEGDEVYYYPHPLLFFDRSGARIRTKVRALKRARVVEAYILGRRGSNEEFAEGDILATTEIYYGDKLLIYDVFRGDKSYRSVNVMGKEALLTVYEVSEGEYRFEKFVSDYREIDRLWRAFTGIHF